MCGMLRVFAAPVQVLRRLLKPQAGCAQAPLPCRRFACIRRACFGFAIFPLREEARRSQMSQWEAVLLSPRRAWCFSLLHALLFSLLRSWRVPALLHQ